MSDTPDVPLRIEATFEVPGTPEQVWQAIATANGISAWLMPTDMEERLGGAVEFHMGETSSKGRITGWEPGRRVEYEEPDWAELFGKPDAAVAPIVTEFLIDAQSGGTCVVHFVQSAFGTGADWEQEGFDLMEQGWLANFEVLRLCLTHFPGQTVTSMDINTTLSRPADEVRSAMRTELGLTGDSKTVDAAGLRGSVEIDDDRGILLRLTDPIPGLVSFLAGEWGGDTTAVMQGHLFSDDAPAYVERETTTWEKWLAALG